MRRMRCVRGERIISITLLLLWQDMIRGERMIRCAMGRDRMIRGEGCERGGRATTGQWIERRWYVITA